MRYAAVVLAWAAMLLEAQSPRLLRVPVWREGDNGEAGGLAAAELRATVAGASARVVRVLGPEDHLLVLLVLDMTEELSLADLAREALGAEVRALPGHVYIAVLRAQDGLKVLVDPTSEREPVLRAIRELPVSGKAGLLESLPAALKLADAIQNRSAVRVALLYVTDSNVYNYRDDYINPVVNWSDQHDLSRRFPEGLIKEKIARLHRQVTAYQTPLAIVHLNYRSDRVNEAYQSGLMQLSASLGGSSQFCRSRHEIPQALAAALTRLRRMHRVDLEAPPRRDGLVQVQIHTESGSLTYRDRFVLP
ncbi:MAG: VWA domain-containing protein [Bryobacterales bacterium]|nr:VWA domain-containing protein [Bryobacterales bacterium]